MKQTRPKSAQNGQFKRRLLHAAIMSAFSGAAVANPTGPTVVNGAVAFNQQGNTLAITNSPNAIINWQSFSINGNETTRFLQQSAASSVLNRVTGIDPSIILGTLQSNGRVFLINPSGIIFGQGSRVDVAGLVASTLNLNNQDFLAGRLNFTDGALAGRISNRGVISTPSGGSVILVAPQIENSGIINAPNGDVILAAGRSVRLGDTAAPNVLVEIQAPDTQAINVGEIVVGGGNASIYAGLINQRGIVKADTPVLGENGKVTFRATKSLNLEAGSITSASGGAQGGSVSLEAPVLYQLGAVHADGATGGSVSIRAGNLLQGGAITVDGARGKGGDIAVNATAVIQTQSALLSARGQTAGGSIVVSAAADESGWLFSSASFLATGTQGGDIKLLGHDIILLGATANASGSAGGGTILIGGDYQGKNPAVPNADLTWINYSTSLRADAGITGAGGKVIVWSDSDTRFAGHISARGGAKSGDGGFIEVSGKENLIFAGMADASAPKGTPGTVLLDPKNIIIDSTAGGLASFQLLDPHPDANAHFGENIVVLPSENVLVTDPSDGFGGISAGAVYLFNSSTGALISALTGSAANDSVGSVPVTVLSNGNYVVNSPNWNGNTGAVTWGNGTAGVSGVVSAANSLVGSTTGDQVGSGGIIQLFATGNYLVSSPLWNTGGAVTWGSGTTGVSGVVSAANSLVGSTAGDTVGSGGIIELSSGNYLVLSPSWGNAAGGPGNQFGAVTWGSGTAGVSGVVSAANSLIGSTAGDLVGSGGIFQLSNGNYVVSSPTWTNGGNGTNVGAVTWGSGTAGVSGAVSAANSLVGSATDDSIGSGGFTELIISGNYVVSSPTWTNGGAGTRVGAVTWGSGTTGVSGVVSAANSLVGSTTDDSIGGEIIELLGTGNYVVRSPGWTNGGAGTNVGAVTWGSGTAGVSGVVSAANSLVGSTPGDAIGSNGVRELRTGNYLVLSPNWAALAGAVTFGDGATGVSGAVSATNSLVGSAAGDGVGGSGVLPFLNGNYLVLSPSWNGAAGAVTWGSGSVGVSGEVSAANSLVGGTPGDSVGSGGIPQLSATGNYLVLSPNWTNGGAGTNVGAVTWGSGTAGVTGVVSAANSLVGSTTGDRIGSQGITELAATGNYVVSSPNWNSDTGAVTWGSGTTGISGVVSSTNSLVGGTPGDGIGTGGVHELTITGNYLVLSFNWTNGGTGNSVGAVTWGSGTAGVSGVVSATNSLVGSVTGDVIGGGGILFLSNGNYVVGSPNHGVGAVTWGSGTAGVSGVVSAANSLVGSTTGDSIGSGGMTQLATTGNYLVLSPQWTNGGAGTNVGAVTWGSGAAGVRGVVSSANSLVGSKTGDRVGTGVGDAVGGITELSNGNYLVTSPVWNGEAGAVTWGSGAAGVSGVVSATNSLVGGTAGDVVGAFGGITQLSDGNYVVSSGMWTNGGAGTNVGAVTWGSGVVGVRGVVSAANSLVGSTTGDSVGSGGIMELSGGHYLVLSPDWSNGAATLAGAVTVGSSDAGVSGAVSAANSVVGTTANDQIGSGGIFPLSNGRFVVSSPLADNGSLVDAGLVHIVVPSAVASGQIFASNATGSVTIAPAAITAITNTGTAVTLQANNDITLNSASDVVTSAGGAGGAITLEAGRSIVLSSSITTDNGELTITANHPGADATNRDAGAGGITMAPGTTLNAGTGSATLTVSFGVPGAASGNLVVDQIVAAGVTLRQNGTTSGSSILRAAPSSLIQATNLTMQVTGGPATGGSIGTALEPILTSGVSRLVTEVSGTGETAVSNTNGVGGPALVIQSMRSVGGNIKLVNDTDIDVTAGDSCDCLRGIDSQGGNVFVQSTAGSITGSDNISASALSFGATFSNGGSIDLIAAQDINLTGDINSDGHSPFFGDTNPVGHGGSINIQAGGTVNLGLVSALGGNERQTSGAGGAGGSVNISGSGTFTIGQVSVSGGDGGGDGDTNSNGGAGGAGGSVAILSIGAAGAAMENLHLIASGGQGGPGSQQNGTGGAGGSVTIGRMSAGDLSVSGFVSVAGGAAGPATTVNNGSGGDGGGVFIGAVSVPLLQHVNPGTPGSLTLNGLTVDAGGGAGPSNGAQGAVHLQSGDGGITQTASLVLNTTDLRIETSGTVTLDNPNNVIPGVWGSIGGDLSVTSLDPIRLGLATPLNVGGNLKVQSIAGSQIVAGPCQADSCIWFTNGVTAGGNIEFYANELEDSGPITTGALDSNFARFAPWTPGTNLLLDTVQTENYFTPHVQVGNPDALTDTNLATWGLVTVTATVEPSNFTSITRSFEIYAHQVDIDAQIGATNAVPLSFIVKALGDINIGRNVDAPFNTTMHLADGNALTLVADAGGTGAGDLSIGRDGAFTNLTIDYATTPSTMTLGGANISFRGPLSVVVNGPGQQVITASNAIQLVNNSAGTLLVNSQGTQRIRAGSGGVLLDAIAGNVNLTGGGQFVGSVFQPSGAQTISVDGPSASLIVRSGLGAATIIGGNQSITVGTGANTGSILIQGGTQAGTTAGITNYAGPQTVSTTGQLQLIAGSAPDQGQGNFRCDLQACANLGNESLTGNQSITAVGGISILGGSGGARNEANIYSRTDQTVVAAGGITLTAGSGAGSGNWASLADVGGTGSAQNVSFGTGGITIRSDSVGGNDSTANIHADGSQVISGTSDIVLIGGTAGFMSWSQIEAGTDQSIGARAISIKALAGAGSTGFFTNDGAQHITTTGGLGGVASAYGITVQNLGALGLDQGGFTSAAHITSRNGSQSIDVSGSRGILISAVSGLAIIDDEGTTQTINVAGTGALDILSGGGTAQVFFDNGSAQTISAGSITLTGGSADTALALIDANKGTQHITTTGALTLTGGTATGPAIPDLSNPPTDCGAVSACAVVIAVAGAQTINANSISITGGSSGTENLATIRGNAGQDITVGSSGLVMQGGGGAGLRNFAFIENYANDQILRFAAGAPLTLTGGTVGIKHFAAIMAMGTSTSQQILGNPVITLTGGASGGGDGSGFFTNFTGNNAYIGTDPDGPVATSQTIHAQSILLQDGFGPNNAALDNFRAGGQQTITAVGDVRLLGGAASSLLAEIMSSGNQSVTARSVQLVGASGGANVAIHAQGGDQTITTSGSGPNGWGVELTNNGTSKVYIEATGAQHITATNGGGILLDAVGGNVDFFGSGQYVNNVFVQNGTQTILVDGSGANAFVLRGGLGTARIDGASQSITAGTGSNAGSIVVQGGAGNGGNAYIFNQAGTQTIATSGQIAVTAGTGTSTSQGLFACDPSACALIGNLAAGGDPSVISQSITAGAGLAITGGSAGSYNEASVFTNGSQNVHAAGGIQVLGGAGTGNYASLATNGGASYSQTIDFGSGNLSVIGGSSGGRSFAGIYSGGNQSISGQGDIVVSGGVLPNAGLPATRNTSTGQVTDAVVYSWAEIVADSGQDASAVQQITARSISITARPGQSSTGIFTPVGQQHIATTGSAANGYGITIENQGAVGPDQNGFGGAAYITTRTGTMSIDVADSGGILIKGTGGLAVIDNEGPAQTINIHGGGAKALDLVAGTGGANIYFANGTAQSITAGSLSLTGGAQNGAYATIDAASGTQTVTVTGALSLHGGTAPGPANANPDTPPSSTTSNSANATLVSRHGKQTISAGSITVAGGSGTNENFANIISDGGQDITVGAGGLTLTGGTGTGVHNYAMIENYGGDQIVRMAAGSALDIAGGTTGVRNFAGIWGGGPISYDNTILGVPDHISTAGTTSQQILGSPNIAIIAGATGGGGDGTESNTARRGNTGFIIAQTGPQQIDAGTMTLTAGGGAGENSAVISTFGAGAAQTINATGAIALTGGRALYTNAEISSGGAQTINAGGLTLAGGNAGGAGLAFAEVSSASGFDQTITLPTNAVLSLTGGSTGVGNSAHIVSGRNQTIDGNPVVTLAGGTGASSDVSIENAIGGTQSFHFGALTITGGSGLDASAAIGVSSQLTIVVAGQTQIAGGNGNGAIARIGSDDDGGNITINLTSGGLALQAGTGDAGSKGYGALALVGAVQATGNEVPPNATVTISSTGDVTLTGATSSALHPVLAIIGTDSSAGDGGPVSVTASGNITQGTNSLIRGSSVTLSALGDVTLNKVVATQADVSGTSAISVTAGTRGNIGIDAENANLTATLGSISLFSPRLRSIRVGSATTFSAGAGGVTLTLDDLNLTSDYTLPTYLTLIPIESNFSVTGPGHALTNQNTLTKISSITAILDNEGTFEVPAGATTTLNGGARGAGGYSFGDAHSTLSFASGNYTVGNISGPGAVDVGGPTGAATVDVGGTYNIPGVTTVGSGGVLNLNSTSKLGTVTVAGALGGTGAVTATRLNLTGGSLLGTGDLTVTDNFAETGTPRAIPNYHNLTLTRQGDFLVGNYTAVNSLTLTSSGGSLGINDVTLTAPTVTLKGANVTLDPTGSAGSTVNGTSVLNISTPGALTLNGTNGPATLNAGTTLSVNAATVNVTAGNHGAKIDPASLDLTVTGDIVLTGGSGPNATAVLSGNDVTISAANVFLTGGAGNGSYAAIEGVSGNTTITAAGRIVMQPGTGLNADASVVGRTGMVTLNAASCVGCVTLAFDPLGNTATDQGVFGVPVVFNIGSATVPVDPSILYAAGISSDGGQANTNYLTSATEEEEQKKSSDNQDEDSGTTSKRKLPICM